MTMIINNVAYQRGRRLSDISIDDISNVVKQPETFVWLTLHQPDDALLMRVQEEFGLHDLSIEDAREASQRPKIEADGESLFIVLKTAQLEQGQVVYGETHLFIGLNFLVSVRHGAASSDAQVRERCEKATNLLAKGPGFALYAVLDFVVDNYLPVVAQFEKDFDAIETDIFKDRFDKLIIERLYGLKRQLLELRNAALPVADISAELMRFHEDLIPKELRAYFRDVQDHVSRLVGLLDGMREVDPISRTPDPYGRRSPICRSPSPRIRRNSVDRWSSWCSPAARRRSSRVSSTAAPKAFRLGSRRLPPTVASPAAAKMC